MGTNEKVVDARGLGCPMPVINTKKAMEEYPEATIITLVDNDVAKENVMKLATSMGYSYKACDRGDHSRIEINIDECAMQREVDKDEREDIVYFITSDVLGVDKKAADHEIGELGTNLMKSFLFTISERSTMPKAIIFMNSGVYLATEDIPALKVMEDKGTTVLSCGTCLNYYGIQEAVKVGTVSNMYEIVETLTSSAKVMKL